MLDENLPTFRLRPSPDSPSSSILYLTQSGSDPSPEYILRRADPVTHPSARGRYAAALCSASSVAEVIYGEVLVEPTWTQPSLSAAELRSTGGVSPPPVPTTPDGFDLMLYNPDYTVGVKMEVSTWTKSETWEFEMPSRSFRTPSASQLDREGERRESGAELGSPRVVFRWKRDGRLSKDMTCYLVGMNVAGKKSKEPDITIAMCKAGKESAVTVYEPNLNRVEVEDRKGLEVVLLLSAEVIRDLYLMSRADVWNVGSGEGGRRKGSRTHTTTPPVSGGGRTGTPPVAAMSGALGGGPPVGDSRPDVTTPGNSAAGIDAETRRLQAMVEREEKERARREKEEQERIKRMLEEEDRERRRREAEVAKETERLRKMYGVQGQDLPSSGPSPPLPPRPQFGLHPSPAGPYGGSSLPPRPVSAQGPVMSGAGSNNWYLGQGPAPAFPGPPPPQQQQQQPNGRTGRTGSGGGSHGLGILNPAASVSQFFGGSREERERKKVQKKRSMHW
jgi:hypothetical protein